MNTNQATIATIINRHIRRHGCIILKTAPKTTHTLIHCENLNGTPILVTVSGRTPLPRTWHLELDPAIPNRINIRHTSGHAISFRVSPWITLRTLRQHPRNTPPKHTATPAHLLPPPPQKPSTTTTFILIHSPEIL